MFLTPYTNRLTNALSLWDELLPWGRDWRANTTNDGWEVTLELPGYAQSEISIEYADEQIVVKAENERRGRFWESFTVGRNVDPEKISAKLENGLLTIELRIDERAKPKKIEVK